MPWFQRENPEDAPAQGDPAPNLAEQAELRPHKLTEELLDWLLAALEAVIRTPEVRSTGQVRVRQSLHDAYKYADRLYPYTAEAQSRAQEADHAHQVREGERLVLGLERALQDQGESSAGSEGSLRPRLQEGEVDGDRT